MPRASRKKSESGVYHIMLRGINQQVIFEENEDYEKFIDVLKKYKIVCGYKLFAYCLMSNHIHIIIKEENENIDQIIKRIAGSYVYWYNSKYYRRGHLFQDRFRSEPIEDNNYLFAEIRYVHQNPLKAEIIDKLGEYKYCSYSDYVNEYSELIDKDFVFQTVSKDAFINFNNEINDEKFLDIDDFVFKINDEDARKIIKKITGCNNTTELQLFSSDERNKYLRKIKQKGISVRQISRLTGISRWLIDKA